MACPSPSRYEPVRARMGKRLATSISTLARAALVVLSAVKRFPSKRYRVAVGGVWCIAGTTGMLQPMLLLLLKQTYIPHHTPLALAVQAEAGKELDVPLGRERAEVVSGSLLCGKARLLRVRRKWSLAKVYLWRTCVHRPRGVLVACPSLLTTQDPELTPLARILIGRRMPALFIDPDRHILIKFTRALAVGIHANARLEDRCGMGSNCVHSSTRHFPIHCRGAVPPPQSNSIRERERRNEASPWQEGTLGCTPDAELSRGQVRRHNRELD